jgi:hypothetical protein
MNLLSPYLSAIMSLLPWSPPPLALWIEGKKQIVRTHNCHSGIRLTATHPGNGRTLQPEPFHTGTSILNILPREIYSIPFIHFDMS